MNNECEHHWQFQHTVYWFGSQVSGSSARYRMIGDRYYCTKCLATAVRNERERGTSYDKPIEGTVPK